MGLPDMSRTAPSIMYSIGADPTASICAASRVASMVISEAVPTDISSRVYRWIGPVTAISGYMKARSTDILMASPWTGPATAISGYMVAVWLSGSLKVMASRPVPGA